MKTIEEKAKAYDIALAKIKMLLGTGSNCSREDLEYVFPELAESEDERIRNEMIEHFEEVIDNITGEEIIPRESKVLIGKIRKWIAWLEKQGNKVSAIEGFETEFEKQVSYLIASAVNKEHEYNQGYVKWTANALLNYAKHELEKQGEQKPTNKVEPKFKIGDLITNGILVGKIDETHEWGYHAYFGDHYADVPDAENWHKWTIQDAKDGDVLVSSSGKPFIFNGLFDNDPMAYGGLVADDSFWPASKSNWTTVYCKPATKEQRAFLFQKMKEAGYEWDAEKNELKKIEQKPTNWLQELEDKLANATPKQLAEWKEKYFKEEPAEWSEDDESVLQNILECLKNGWLPTDFLKYESWLKSLRPQNTWKPSKEQIKAVEESIEFLGCTKKVREDLKSLCEQLKKLKG